jgi:hypothetical protein
MSISPVGHGNQYVPPPAQHKGRQAPAPKEVPVKAGGDADGDNDGTKPGQVDVRA